MIQRNRALQCILNEQQQKYELDCTAFWVVDIIGLGGPRRPMISVYDVHLMAISHILSEVLG